MIHFVQFPEINQANEDGVLAVGGDLTIDTLVSAYQQGIFPWYCDGQPVIWWSPDPRMVLYPKQIKISRSLKKIIRQQNFIVGCNQVFDQVITACAAPRDYQVLSDTWINADMIEAYKQLHQTGYAHSIEVWLNQELVGGLYGIALGKVFFGESMFSRTSNASKIALLALCQFIDNQNFSVIDCQVANDHLISLGAQEIDRADFLKHLEDIDIQATKPNFGLNFKNFFVDGTIKLL